MNTYLGGDPSQGKIFTIKRHFASLISGIISDRLHPLDRYSYEISKPKLVCIKQDIPALCKISDTQFTNVLDDTGLRGRAYLIKNIFLHHALVMLFIKI